MGLNIIYPDDDLEELLWKLWLDYADELKMDSDFNIMNEINKQPEFKSWVENISDSDMKSYLTAAQYGMDQAKIPNINITIKFDLILACIESCYTKHKLCMHYTVNVWRKLDLSVGNTYTYVLDDWKKE